MNFDEYFDKLQKAWRCQHANAKISMNADPDLLLEQVRRNEHRWAAINFWGAVLEITGEFLMTLFFLYYGVRRGSWTPFRLPDWDFLLVAMACAGVGTFRTFMLVNRIAQRRKKAPANEPLKVCIEASLDEVNHDIWLQRNIFWWSLLPFTVALAISFGYGSLRAHNPMFLGFLVLFVIPLDWAFYRLTRFTVRKVLEPRRQELESLLSSLK